MLRIFRVLGGSMKPVLHEGDFVVALTALRRAKLNRMLVVHHLEYGIIIKRVIGVEADGSCWLASENNSGVGSLRIGKIAPWQVLGSVLWSIKKNKLENDNDYH